MLQIYQMSYITIAVLAFIINSLLCFFHCCFKRVRRIHDMFLVSHYTANVLQALSVIVYCVRPQLEKYLTFSLNLAFSSSVLSLTAASFMRLSKTLWVSHYIDFFSGKLPYVTLGVLWVLALGVAVPPILGWGAPLLFLGYPVMVSTSYAVIYWSVSYALPLISISVFNCKLFSRVRIYEQRSRRDVGLQNSRTRREGEAKWIILFQVVVFALCVTPVAIETTIASIVSRHGLTAVQHIFNCLALTHCLLSPVLRNFTNREIRREVTCCCYKRTFVLQGQRSKRKRRRGELDRGRYRSDTRGEPFIVHREGRTCDQVGSYDVYCASPERFVRFDGTLPQSSASCHDNIHLRVYRPWAKRPITTEVAPIRRHSTLRKQDEKPKINRHKQMEDRTKVQFDAECIEKQRKKYFATPSAKKMRRIKKDMLSMSLSGLQSSIASLSGSELEIQRHVVPHFTNYSDPMRSAGFRQVLTGRMKVTRTSSLKRLATNKPKTKRFIQRRCSAEGECAIRNATTRLKSRSLEEECNEDPTTLKFVAN